MIIVTPHLAQPVSDINQLTMPTDGLSVPSDFDAFIGSKIEGGVALNLSELSSDYGTVLE